MKNPSAAMSYGQNIENTGVSLYSPYGRICLTSMIGFWDVAVKVGRHIGLRLSCGDVGSDHFQIVCGGFEGALSVTAGNETSVIVKGQVAFPAQAIKNR